MSGEADRAILTAPFTIEPADHAAFQKEFARGRLKWIVHALVVGAAGLNIVIGVSRLSEYFRQGNLLAAPWGNWINLLLGVLLLAGYGPLRSYSVRRTYRALGLEGLVQEMKIDADGVVVTRAGGHSETAWSVMHGYSDLADHFVFWFNQRLGLILPKRALPTPDDAARIRAWLLAAGVSSQGRRAKPKRQA